MATFSAYTYNLPHPQAECKIAAAEDTYQPHSRCSSGSLTSDLGLSLSAVFCVLEVLRKSLSGRQ